MNTDSKYLLLVLSVLLLCLSLTLNAGNYFQQDVNYSIRVKLNDQNHSLSCFEEITYKNNSQDTLHEIYFHLWPNAYRNNETALAKQLLEEGKTDFYFSKPEERGYIDSLYFSVDGQEISWNYDKEHIDICLLKLLQPLLPGATIKISTPFHVKIPKSGFSRLGHAGQSYQISQWYPKPAVYDDRGWHPMPYLNQGEFYSEFGSFDVEITLPDNYVVGSTGNLQTASETEFLNKLADASEDESNIVKIATPPSSQKLKTIRYIQDNIHDFAWFADKRYQLYQGTVNLSGSWKQVKTQVFFLPEHRRLFRNSLSALKNATYYYSMWLGDYPYETIAIAEGELSAGGGMEYPNIAVIPAPSTPKELELVIVHEAGHNWFYGILGSNERAHPWMDEGINSFYEMRYFYTHYADYPESQQILSHLIFGLQKYFDLSKVDDKMMHRLEYLFQAKRNLDQPIEGAADQFSTFNYGGIVYSKTAIAFDYLKAYLGDSIFDRCMKYYYETWKFKHPYPENVKKAFETVSRQNLSWFFDDLINTRKKLDYSISNIRKDGQMLLRNKGTIVAPVVLGGLKDSMPVELKWLKGFPKDTIIKVDADLKKYILDPFREMPEVKGSNNTIRIQGFFKKTEPFRFKFGGGLTEGETSDLYYFPVAGWNQYDKLMPGILLYNRFVLPKKTEFAFMPMYGLGSNSIAGGAYVMHNFYPENTFLYRISPNLSGSSYSYSNQTEILQFRKVVPGISLQLKEEARSKITRTVRIQSYLISKDVPTYDLSSKPYRRYITNSSYYINTFNYIHDNNHTLFPRTFTLNIQQGDGFIKSAAELLWRSVYAGKNRFFEIRCFAGKFLYNKGGKGSPYSFRMRSWYGADDYLFDDIYLGRSESKGLLSNQMTIKEGGFKLPVFTGSAGFADQWLAAVNLKTSLPGRLPLKLYLDIGTFANASSFYPEKNPLIYNGGVQLTLIPEILNIYFPVVMSNQLSRIFELNNITYSQLISFELNLNKLNPFNLVRDLK